MIRPRAIDLNNDRAALLEFHCRINYENDSTWARTMPFTLYGQRWLNTPRPEEFLAALATSMMDKRTIAEVWEDEKAVVGYLWVVFIDLNDYNLTFAEVNDMAVVPEYQRLGIAFEMLAHSERLARERGAHLLRSGTGIENIASQKLHEKYGFKTYRLQYEKLLVEESVLNQPLLS